MTDVVLIHGGSTTGSYWDLLRPLVQHSTIAPDLPGRRDRPADLMELTIEAAVTSFCADLDAGNVGDRVILMAHSSGGLFAPGVARHLGERLVHIVLSSASVPPDGGTGLDCMKPRHADGCRAMMAHARTTGTVVTTLDGLADRDLDQIRASYGGDALSDDLARYMADPVRRVGDSYNVYFQPVTWRGVPDVPITWLLNLRDRPIPVELQRTMLARLPRPPRIVEIDGGHVPSVVDPELVAEVLNDLS